VLPSRLKWIEVDLPDLLAYKAEALAAETPVCMLGHLGAPRGRSSSGQDLHLQDLPAASWTVRAFDIRTSRALRRRRHAETPDEYVHTTCGTSARCDSR
jgi:hypothetical protein